MDERVGLRPEGLSWRIVDDEIVVLDAGRSVYFAGNRTATLLWHELAAGARRGDLIDRLVDAYGVDRATASHDLDSFLSQLSEHGLLVE